MRADIEQLIGRFDAATNTVAAKLQALKDKVAAGELTQDEIAAALGQEVADLEAIGRDPENPIPVAPVE